MTTGLIAGALGLEDHGQLPPELQRRVHEEVEQTKCRSGWPAKKTLATLGVAARSYYRWLKEEAWAGDRPAEPSPPVSPYEALSEEKQAVLAFARKRPELRHRELAWRMVDEDVAYLSPSTVYRILKAADLVCPWRRRTRRKKAQEEKASRPDQRWSTDLMHVQVAGRVYYVVAFLDEYSRYIVHHELLSGMDGLTVSRAAQKAIETLPEGPDGKPAVTPLIRSDNGSCYISKEFRAVLRENGLGHHRIRPHCPEENGLIERANRTLREALDGEELTDLLTAGRVLARLVRAVQRGAAAQRVGLPAAVGVLPGRAVAAVRGAADQAVPGQASPPGAEPGTASGDLATGRGEAVTSDRGRFVPLRLKRYMAYRQCSVAGRSMLGLKSAGRRRSTRALDGQTFRKSAGRSPGGHRQVQGRLSRSARRASCIRGTSCGRGPRTVRGRLPRGQESASQRPSRTGRTG